MPVPSFDFPGANGELINLKDWRVVQRPNRIEDLTQCATLVIECRSRPDLNSIDQFQNRLAVARRRLNVLLWFRSHTGPAWIILPRKSSSQSWVTILLADRLDRGLSACSQIIERITEMVDHMALWISYA